MTSRKRAKGKARKAAKEAAKVKESQAAVAGNQRQRLEESLEAQMQRLQISHSHGSSMTCRHGVDNSTPICIEFIVAFISAYISISEGSLLDAFDAADEATAGEKFAEVYSSRLETVVSKLVAAGTDCILDGENATAQLYAALACYFEELIAVSVRHTEALINWVKVVEMHGADEHTLVKFLRKQIPCHCLDEKYKAVKSVKKMGKCCNVNCSLPGRKIERSKMFSCARAAK